MLPYPIYVRLDGNIYLLAIHCSEKKEKQKELNKNINEDTTVK